MRRIRTWLLFFMGMLFLSGLTALPVESELKWLSAHFPFEGSIRNKFRELYLAVRLTGTAYPNLFYGYDWLAFAHFMLAVLFIGPVKNPVRNRWIIDFGIICCLLVIPYAMIAGHFRQIPVWWRMVDGSFGLLGLVPLLVVRSKLSNRLKRQGRHRVSQFKPDYSII